MLRWYKELRADQKRTFWACFGGWATDALDVQIYGFVIPALISLWNLSKSDAGLLAMSTLLLSTFGGWIAGILADQIGRVRMLQITIAWFSVFTCLSGLTSNFGQLLVIRGLQGLGFGGEWAAGSVLMAEVIRNEHRNTENGGQVEYQGSPICRFAVVLIADESATGYTTAMLSTLISRGSALASKPSVTAI